MPVESISKRMEGKTNVEAYHQGYEDGYNVAVERYIEIEKDRDNVSRSYGHSTFTNILM